MQAEGAVLRAQVARISPADKDHDRTPTILLCGIQMWWQQRRASETPGGGKNGRNEVGGARKAETYFFFVGALSSNGGSALSLFLHITQFLSIEKPNKYSVL